MGLGTGPVERVIGGDHGEHRGEAGVDHPGALRHPADREALAAHDGLLRARVGGEDRLGRRGAPLGPERLRRAADPVEDPGQRQRHADHARREHEDLVRPVSEELGRPHLHRQRVVLAPRARGGVRDPGVDDHGLRLRRRERAP
jgi:hypothetical protein